MSLQLAAAALLARRLRDRFTVELDPPGPGDDISVDVFLDGETGHITADSWTVDYTFSSADAYDDNLASAPATWLILDDATDGKLDTGRLGY